MAESDDRRHQPHASEESDVEVLAEAELVADEDARPRPERSRRSSGPERDKRQPGSPKQRRRRSMPNAPASGRMAPLAAGYAAYSYQGKGLGYQGGYAGQAYAAYDKSFGSPGPSSPGFPSPSYVPGSPNFNPGFGTSPGYGSPSFGPASPSYTGPMPHAPAFPGYGPKGFQGQGNFAHVNSFQGLAQNFPQGNGFQNHGNGYQPDNFAQQGQNFQGNGSSLPGPTSFPAPAFPPSGHQGNNGYHGQGFGQGFQTGFVGRAGFDSSGYNHSDARGLASPKGKQKRRAK